MREPPRNRDLTRLNAIFRRKLLAVIADLKGHGLTLMVNEGWRSAERQRWLYAQGRTRPGPVVTYKSGNVGDRSYHQTGKAADLYFVSGAGRLWLPPLRMPNGGLSPEWKLVKSSAEAHSLNWGGTWGDGPHLEWR